MKKLTPATFFLFLLSAFMALPGCPKPTPEPGKPGIIDCTVEAVRDRGLPLVPRVNDCLTQQVDWQHCLISLISPVAGITEDIVACVVDSSGRSYAQSAAANPKDGVSNTAAQRAREFIQERGYQFKGSAQGGGP